MVSFTVHPAGYSMAKPVVSSVYVCDSNEGAGILPSTMVSVTATPGTGISFSTGAETGSVAGGVVAGAAQAARTSPSKIRLKMVFCMLILLMFIWRMDERYP